MNRDADMKPGPGSFAPKSDPRLTLQPRLFELSSTHRTNDEHFERQFLEEVVSSDPCYEEALMVLGHVYTRHGEYEKGLAIDQRLVRLRPSDPTAYYNLACSYCLLGQNDDGLTALERAVSLGYRDVVHMMKDPDLAPIRQDTRFRNIMSRIIAGSPANS
jgi:tetratricopeptide (TPR) repeat protein